MKKLLIVMLLAGAVYACTQLQQSDPSIYNSFCDTGGNEPCSHLPIDVNETFGVGYDSFLDTARQPQFDVFSWQTFIALNWPADSAGNPSGGSISDNPAAFRVWEYYKDPAEVFGAPLPELEFHLTTAKQSGQKFLYMDSKSPHRLLPIKGFEEADGHPLIDRNLNFALYEIKMNPVETEFVKKYQLTTVANIGAYYVAQGNKFELPQSDSATKNPGSLEIKASWRILDSARGDDPARYYTRDAIIYIDTAHTVKKFPLIIRVKVGLVGMHIIRKTAKLNSAQVWSTFEHVDNTPDSPQEAQASPTRKWSFYNRACLNCLPNDTPAFQDKDYGQYRWDSTPPYGKRYAVNAPGQGTSKDFGTQAVRVYPVWGPTDQINKLWQDKLQGTVWANYRLIGSQWKLSEIYPSPTAPNNLANTTLETYIQASASCIDCHGSASVTYIPVKGDTLNISTDFSFLFPVYAR
jgi:hypothetical protein